MELKLFLPGSPGGSKKEKKKSCQCLARFLSFAIVHLNLLLLVYTRLCLHLLIAWFIAICCRVGQVRHPDQATLKRLKNLPLMLVRKISNNLSVPVHASMMSVSTAGKPPPALCLRR